MLILTSVHVILVRTSIIMMYVRAGDHALKEGGKEYFVFQEFGVSKEENAEGAHDV